jgi:hypothetical protein
VASNASSDTSSKRAIFSLCRKLISSPAISQIHVDHLFCLRFQDLNGTTLADIKSHSPLTSSLFLTSTRKRSFILGRRIDDFFDIAWTDHLSARREGWLIQHPAMASIKHCVLVSWPTARVLAPQRSRPLRRPSLGWSGAHVMCRFSNGPRSQRADLYDSQGDGS